MRVQDRGSTEPAQSDEDPDRGGGVASPRYRRRWRWRRERPAWRIAACEVGEDGAFELADDGRSEVILFGFALDEDVPSL